VRQLAIGTFLVTAVVLYFMIAPSTAPGIAGLSRLFGGTELTDAVGHVGLFCLLTLMWFQVLRHKLSVSKSLISAIIIVGVMATCAEILQGFVPQRGSTGLDLLANWSGVALFVLGWLIVNNRLKIKALLLRQKHPEKG
jgi:VanZ family protein